MAPARGAMPNSPRNLFLKKRVLIHVSLVYRSLPLKGSFFKYRRYCPRPSRTADLSGKLCDVRPKPPSTEKSRCELPSL